MSPMMDSGASLGDIEDIESFVRACIARSKIRPDTPDKLEELMCEAYVLLYELWVRYDPARDGGREATRAEVAARGTRGVKSFAGYAWYLMPLKVIDAWHRMHPEHVMRTQPDGTRKWEYHEPPASIEERTRMHPEYLDYERHRRPGEFVRS